MLFFPALVHYPMYDSTTDTQYFPFKTMSMLCSLFGCVFGSLSTEYLFRGGHLQPEMDILGCVVNIDSARVILPSDTSFNVSCETLAMQNQPPKLYNQSPSPTNGFLSVNGGGSSTTTRNNFAESCNEQTSLQATQKQDYASLLIR